MRQLPDMWRAESSVTLQHESNEYKSFRRFNRYDPYTEFLQEKLYSLFAGSPGPGYFHDFGLLFLGRTGRKTWCTPHRHSKYKSPRTDHGNTHGINSPVYFPFPIHSSFRFS